MHAHVTTLMGVLYLIVNKISFVNLIMVSVLLKLDVPNTILDKYVHVSRLMELLHKFVKTRKFVGVIRVPVLDLLLRSLLR